ncbi:MAG: KUP/HAK/KT family potassium transporter [Saprospiraceae bacterium]|nr:KUP/HAK/KT family potassium transporter [Saprospiraceae bacterium]
MMVSFSVNTNGSSATLMPSWFLPIGLFIATLAAIIASQALISGVFTLVNEAMKLKLWLKMKVNHPTDWLGRVYILVSTGSS